MQQTENGQIRPAGKSQNIHRGFSSVIKIFLKNFFLKLRGGMTMFWISIFRP